MARWLVVLVLLAGLGVGGWFVYSAATGSDSAEPDPTPPEDAEPGTIIGETEQLVDDINTRPEVADLFDELDLDETGQPIVPPDDPALEQPVVGSYTFDWSDPSGFSTTVTVDQASGNFDAVTSDGVEIRRVDGRYFGRSPEGEWIELAASAEESVPVIGIDGPLRWPDLIDGPVMVHVVAMTTTDTEVRALVDDAGLASVDPSAREAWLAPWGLLPDTAVDPIDRTDAVVPEQAAPGDVLVVATLTPDRWVTSVELSSPAIGGTATYTLGETSADPLTIELPDAFAE